MISATFLILNYYSTFFLLQEENSQEEPIQKEPFIKELFQKETMHKGLMQKEPTRT